MDPIDPTTDPTSSNIQSMVHSIDPTTFIMDPTDPTNDPTQSNMDHIDPINDPTE